MDFLIAIVLSIFAAYGVICFAVGLYKMVMHRGIEGKYVIMTIKKHDAEGVVRSALRENPDSEIIVINKDTSPETAEVLRRMEEDFPQVHIV